MNTPSIIGVQQQQDNNYGENMVERAIQLVVVCRTVFRLYLSAL